MQTRSDLHGYISVVRVKRRNVFISIKRSIRFRLRVESHAQTRQLKTSVDKNEFIFNVVQTNIM